MITKYLRVDKASPRQSHKSGRSRQQKRVIFLLVIACKYQTFPWIEKCLY